MRNSRDWKKNRFRKNQRREESFFNRMIHDIAVRHGIWKQAVSVLACIVVFVTTYSLILPAVTLEKETAGTVGMVMDEILAETSVLSVEDGGDFETVGTDFSVSEESYHLPVAAVEESIGNAASELEETEGENTDDPQAGDLNEADPSIENGDFLSETTQLQPEDVRFVTGPLIYETEEYTARATFGADAEIPENTVFRLASVSDADILKYQSAAEEKLSLQFDETFGWKDGVFYQASFRNGEDTLYPAAPVDIQIEYKKNMESHEGETIFAVICPDADWTPESLILCEKNLDDSLVATISGESLSEIDLKEIRLSSQNDIFGIITVDNNTAEDNITSSQSEENEAGKDPSDRVTYEDSAEPKTDSAESQEDPSESTDELKKDPSESTDKPEKDSAEPTAEPEDASAVVYEAGELSCEGSDYTVTLNYPAEAQIPAGAAVSARELQPETDEYDQYLTAAKQAMGLEASAVLPAEQARFFDITILDKDGVTELEPKAAVTVQITYVRPITVADADQMSALHFANEDTLPEFLEVQDVQTEENDDTAVTAVSFDSESFSVFGIVYTVDFYFGNYEYHLQGEGEMLLSDLFAALSIEENAADAAEVMFSRPDLLKVEQTENDWLLTSLLPFDTEEYLMVVMANGEKYIIRVTDAINAGYMVDFHITSTFTGTAPFDEKVYEGEGDEEKEVNVRGNDTSAGDNRVRSYDSIIYNVDAQAQSHTANVKEYGNLIYTFKVKDDDELELDLANMGWAEQIGEIDRTSEEGYKIYTVRTKEPVEMPGHHMPQFTLKVGNKTEGYEIHPEISVKVEGNEKVLTAEQVPTTVVTSKPAYNVQLDIVNKLGSIGEYTIDGKKVKGMPADYAFSVQMRNAEPNKGLKGIELPKSGEPITFDIDLSSSYRMDGSSAPIDLMKGLEKPYYVLLNGTEENGATTTADHQLPASSGQNVLHAPTEGIVYRNGNVTITQEIDKEEKTNILKVTINASEVTDISQFPIADADGVERFLNSDGSLLIGNISVFRFNLVQVTEWTDDEGKKHSIQGDAHIGENSANGTVEVVAEVTDLYMKSVTDAETGTGEGHFPESLSSDNRQVTNRQLYGGNAVYDHEIFFSTHMIEEKTGTDNNGKTSNWLENSGINSGTDRQNKDDGSDTAVIGNEIWFTAYFDQSEINVEANELRTIAYNQFVKFDNAVLEPAADRYDAPKTNIANGNVWRNDNTDWSTLDIQFVGKAGGWEHHGLKPWENGYDEEMIHAKEEDAGLYFADSLSGLPEGYECVGLLLKWRGCSVVKEHNSMNIANQVKLQIKNLSENPDIFERDPNGDIISSYMITMSTNAWTINDLLTAYPNDQNYKDWITWIKGDTEKRYDLMARFAMNRVFSDNNGVDGAANQHYFTLSETPHSVDVDRDDNYVKCKYGASGYIGKGTAGFLHGDTLYIVPYTTTVTKKVAQLDDNGNSKKSFDLDTKQRYVDFEITGRMQFTQKINIGDGGEGNTGQDNISTYDWRTTVTLTDTMDDGLTYIPGSAYLDGTYTSHVPNAGTVIGGTPIDPVQNGQTLVFTIPDVPVAAGRIPTIHYSCRIGNTDYPEQDVHNNAQLKNQVTVQTSEDKRRITSENGNIANAGLTVTKTDKYNIEKYGTDSIELDGEGIFHLVVNNDSEDEKKQLYAIDFLPQSSDHLKGQYKLKSLQLLLDPLKKPEGETGYFTDDISFYYATEESQLYTDAYVKDHTFEKKFATAANEISLERVRGWYPASFDQNTGIITIPEEGLGNGHGTDWPLAIAYVDETLPKRRTAHIELRYEGNCGRVSDRIDNVLSEALLYAQASADVYSRNLSGIAWFDLDKDGQIDTEERRLKDVTVTLYKLDAYGHPILTEKVMETTTNEKGEYSFGVMESDSKLSEAEIKSKILRAGDYAIVFSGEPIKEFQGITTKFAEGVADPVNSKSDAVNGANNQLTGAIIRKVHMMSINEMKTDAAASQSHVQEIKYQNAGFIVSASIAVTKEIATEGVKDSSDNASGTFYAALYQVAETRESYEESGETKERTTELETMVGEPLAITVKNGASDPVVFSGLDYGKRYRIYEVIINGNSVIPVKSGEHYNDDFIVRYDGNQDVTINTDDVAKRFTLTIRNNREKADYTVQKRWMHDSNDKWYGDTYQPAGITEVHYMLFRKFSDGYFYQVDENGNKVVSISKLFTMRASDMATIKLPEDDTTAGVTTSKETGEIHWAHTFSDLPGLKDDYYVVECSADGTKIMQDPHVTDHVKLGEGQSVVPTASSRYMSCWEFGRNETKSGGVQAFKNNLTSVIAKKVWNDGDLSVNTHPNVTFILRKTVDGQTTVVTKTTVEGEKVPDTRTITPDTTAKDDNGLPYVEWTHLPMYDYETGAEIVYTVVENPVPGYEKEVNYSQEQKDGETNPDTKKYLEIFDDLNDAPQLVGTLYQPSYTFTNKAVPETKISLVIRKVDKDDVSIALEGAVFRLYQKTDGQYYGVTNPAFTATEAETGTFTIPKEGITLTDLGDGEYKLEEKHAPEGYVITGVSEIYFAVSAGKVNLTDSAGLALTLDNSTDSAEKLTQFVSYSTVKKDSDTDEEKILTIKNERGMALPSTGGAGTRLLYIIGAILIFLAFVLLITKVRVDVKRQRRRMMDE